MRTRVTAAFGKETVRFVVVGGSAAALLATLTFGALRSPLPPFAGTLLAYAVTVVASYLAQQRWTFRGRHGHAGAFPRYCLTQMACAAGAAGLAQMLRHGGMAAGPVSLITTATASAASYLASRFWVFAGKGA